MADIIPLDPKIDNARQKQKQGLARRKKQTVSSVLREIRPAANCEKCGFAVTEDAQDPQGTQVHVPYRFCAGCAGEYIDFIQRLQGGGDPKRYWQNRSWIESWKRWIDYKGSLHSFAGSKEFRRLVKEIETVDPTN